MNKEFLAQYGISNYQENICIEYAGHISQIMIKEMLISLRIEAEIKEINLSILNKINTSFIEITQNILKYSKRLSGTYGDYLNKVSVFRDNGKCYLVSSNVIGENSKKKITKRINEIQTFDKNQINEKYFELCKNGEQSHMHGGGVGLYQMARKSDGIKYTISKISDSKYYLNIMVIIDIN